MPILLRSCLCLLCACLSFWGICSLLKHRFQLDACVAPLVAACLLISALMLGGMLGAVRWVKYAIWALGIAALAYDKLIRRGKIDILPLAVICVCALFCALRFRNQLYTENDSVSHWGLVANYLAQYQRFPDASVEYVFFQSYPLGTACLIYFFTGGLPTEGFCLGVQFMFKLIAFLPVLSFVRKNRWLGRILSAISFLFLSTLRVNITSLQVDTLMPLLALGATSGMLYHRSDLRKAALIALPTIAALVWIKSSGAFFAAVLVLQLTALAYIFGGGKRAAVGMLALGAAVIAVSFVSWNLHVKHAFEGGFATKHAVSLSAYAQNLHQKDGALVRKIALGLVSQAFSVKSGRCMLLLCWALMLLVCRVALRRKVCANPVPWLRCWRACAIGSVALMVIWYAMLFFMYLFSMPVDEASRLASVDRYEMTMLIYIFGLVLIYVLAYFCREEMRLTKGFTRLALTATALCAVVLCIASFAGINLHFFDLFARAEVPEVRRSMCDLNEKYEIESGKRYLIYTDHSQLDLGYSYYLTKYQYASNDIVLISNHVGLNEADPQAFYIFRETHSNYNDYGEIEDPSEALLEYADSCDYILLLNFDPQFEAEVDQFLAEYQGDTPVLRAYD